MPSWPVRLMLEKALAKLGVLILVVPAMFVRLPIVRLILFLPAPQSGVVLLGKNNGNVAPADPVSLTVAFFRLIELSGTR
jgi:hypothetical protein